ncbi:keratin, type I cytoskeletal 19-like [Phyllobates terribilis]|uniref:keratin, type I cytoskeletal 19-like n=1 Tax=Phyllobates terribilis TaxID=111132 RepID=UPI003CCA9533
MGYRIVHPLFGTKTQGEYLTYPKYRSHLSSDYDQNKSLKMNGLQNGAHYRERNAQSAFRDSKHLSSPCGQATQSNYAVYKCHMSNFADYNTSKDDDLLSFDEKKTMQSLNGRLASYLENVESMEEENALLEKKICKWYEENQNLKFPDCSQYFNIIMDLQNQVLSARAHNDNLSQKIKDEQMTADGYRRNYEAEVMIKTRAEDEISNHYGLLVNINMESQSLDSHIQYIEEELLQVKKTSQEEITCLQAQLGTRVNVEVEPAPSIDLNAALSEIRNEYETLMERNLHDIEKLFHEKISELSLEVSSNIEQLQLSSNELTELKLCVHTLETELKKQLSLISANESTLAEIHEHYGSYLSHLQGLININESHLAEIQSKLKQLNNEYNVNLEMKISLEKEIDAYKYLLEELDNLASTLLYIEESDGLLSSRNSSWKMTEVDDQFWCETDEDTSEQLSYEWKY